jgi:thiol-disulfide isomerase/thioredoxin
MLIRSIAHHLAGEQVALPVEGHLPSFDGATRWLNAQALSPEKLRGRVVLVDFWTYTCVNWLRTAPYLRAWSQRYQSDGLTVIGVHTPEFGFEHDLDNVEKQSRELRVEYPIAVDNDYLVWRAFSNHYWPALYLADVDGRIRYHHFGEGEYAATEMAVQQLLMEAGADGIGQDLVAVEPHGLEVAADWSTLGSPETYLGYGQATGFASANDATFDEPHRYAIGSLRLNQWALSGIWTLTQRAAQMHEPGGSIAFRFHARDVNLVMGPMERERSVRFRVFLDGDPAVGARGVDAPVDQSVVRDQRTYQLIRQAGSIEERLFEIEFLDPDIEAYCFTFG